MKRKLGEMKSKEILMYGMLESHRSVLHFQKLIDEWNDPKETIQRTTEIIKQIHGFYGVIFYKIYRELKNGKN